MSTLANLAGITQVSPAEAAVHFYARRFASRMKPDAWPVGQYDTVADVLDQAIAAAVEGKSEAPAQFSVYLWIVNADDLRCLEPHRVNVLGTAMVATPYAAPSEPNGVVVMWEVNVA